MRDKLNSQNELPSRHRSSVKISQHGEQRVHTLYMQEKSSKMKISIYTYWKLAKPRQFKQLQNTASTDWRCEYLNGYVTVQHRSFRKHSFLDPRSSISETRDSILTSWDSILASQNSKQSSFEMRGSSLKFRASSVNLLLSGTGQISVQRKWKRKEIFAVGLVNSVLNLPDGQVIFGGEFKHRRTVINPAHQIFLGWLKWLSG